MKKLNGLVWQAGTQTVFHTIRSTEDAIGHVTSLLMPQRNADAIKLASTMFHELFIKGTVIAKWWELFIASSDLEELFYAIQASIGKSKMRDATPLAGLIHDTYLKTGLSNTYSDTIYWETMPQGAPANFPRNHEGIEFGLSTANFNALTYIILHVMSCICYGSLQPIPEIMSVMHPHGGFENIVDKYHSLLQQQQVVKQPFDTAASHLETISEEFSWYLKNHHPAPKYVSKQTDDDLMECVI